MLSFAKQFMLQTGRLPARNPLGFQIQKAPVPFHGTGAFNIISEYATTLALREYRERQVQQAHRAVFAQQYAIPK